MNETKPPSEKFKELIIDILKTQIEEDDKKLKFIFNINETTAEFEITKERIEEIFSSLDSMNIEGDTILHGDQYYETLVSFEIPQPFITFPHIFRSHGKQIKKEDQDSELTYEISAPTDEYLVFILQRIIENEHGQRIMRPRSSILHEFKDTKDLLPLLKRLIPRLYTLKITSGTNHNLNQFVDLSNSFIFSLSYNLDISIIETKFIDKIMRSNRLSRIGRAKFEDVDPPRRKYIADLVYHFQMAISTDSALLQFMSFYHVLEHFFEEIYSQDLIDATRDKITNPGFSYKRKKDLRDLIKFIEKKSRQRGEDFSHHEKEALKLTLEKYLYIENIKTQIEKYDETLIDYYKNNVVIFSHGDKVDLTLNQQDLIFENLASRIYKTRNSIVHSKEGNKPRYVPFKHDKELIKEMPLLRFVAEDIIINTSESL